MSPSAMVRRSRRVIRLPISMKSREAAVMKPRPPICVKSRITPCPKWEKANPVSTTVSPVTQVEVVAVNRAESRGRGLPSTELIGRHRSAVPTRMTAKKPRARTWVGCIWWLCGVWAAEESMGILLMIEIRSIISPAYPGSKFKKNGKREAISGERTFLRTIMEMH